MVCDHLETHSREPLSWIKNSDFQKIMGTYCGLTINKYDIFEIKNSYHDEVVNLIFDEADFVIEQSKGDDYVSKKFVSNVGICKKKLEIYGNTLQKAKSNFEICLKKYKIEYEVTFENEQDISFKNYQKIIASSINKGTKEYDDCDNPFSLNFEEFLNQTTLHYQTKD